MCFEGEILIIPLIFIIQKRAPCEVTPISAIGLNSEVYIQEQRHQKDEYDGRQEISSAKEEQVARRKYSTMPGAVRHHHVRS